MQRQRNEDGARTWTGMVDARCDSFNKWKVSFYRMKRSQEDIFLRGFHTRCN